MTFTYTMDHALQGLTWGINMLTWYINLFAGLPWEEYGRMIGHAFNAPLRAAWSLIAG